MVMLSSPPNCYVRVASCVLAVCGETAMTMDKWHQVWDVASGQCVHTLRGHNDEILDVSFNATGSRLVTASADGTSRVFNTMTGACQSILIGHEGEISKVRTHTHVVHVVHSSTGA